MVTSCVTPGDRTLPSLPSTRVKFAGLYMQALCLDEFIRYFGILQCLICTEIFLRCREIREERYSQLLYVAGFFLEGLGWVGSPLVFFCFLYTGEVRVSIYLVELACAWGEGGMGKIWLSLRARIYCSFSVLKNPWCSGIRLQSRRVYGWLWLQYFDGSRIWYTSTFEICSTWYEIHIDTKQCLVTMTPTLVNHEPS